MINFNLVIFFLLLAIINITIPLFAQWRQHYVGYEFTFSDIPHCTAYYPLYNHSLMESLHFLTGTVSTLAIESAFTVS